MKKTFLKNFIFLLILISLLILPYFVFAKADTPTPPAPLEKLQSIGSGANGPFAAATESSAAEIAGIVVGGALSVLGIIFVILIVIAGFQLMNAGGNQEQISKASIRIRTAFIGLLIVLGSYGIWTFIESRLIG